MRRHERGADPGSDFIKTIEIKNRGGQVVERKEVVTAKGLLHLAHKERLSDIRTEIAQTPSKDNGETAIVLVRVTTQRGAFSGLGDANPRNVNARIAPHFIRMAETRALARALRAALDIGVVAIEELEGEFSFSEPRQAPRNSGPPEDAASSGPPRETDGREGRAPNERPPFPRTSGNNGSSGGGGGNGGGYGPGYGDAPMSDPQKRLMYRLAFDQGHEGDAARTWLHAELGVDSLSKVTKRQASAFIDRFKPNGTNGHAAGAS